MECTFKMCCAMGVQPASVPHISGDTQCGSIYTLHRQHPPGDSGLLLATLESGRAGAPLGLFLGDTKTDTNSDYTKTWGEDCCLQAEELGLRTQPILLPWTSSLQGTTWGAVWGATAPPPNTVGTCGYLAVLGAEENIHVQRLLGLGSFFLGAVADHSIALG